MKKWILKRSNGQVVSISDEEPTNYGNLILQKITLDQSELNEALSHISLKEENGALVSADTDNVPVEIRPLIQKIKDKQNLSAEEKDELLLALVNKVL